MVSTPILGYTQLTAPVGTEAVVVADSASTNKYVIITDLIKKWFGQVDANGNNLVGINYEDLNEITLPATPAANTLRLYGKLDGGFTKLFYVQEDGTEVGPIGGGGGALGNLAYLSKKEFDGKLRQNDSDQTTVTDLATLTANTGKDMYLVTAKTVWQPSGAGGSARVELSINGTVVEVARWGTSGTSDQGGDYQFSSLGHKVAASQIIKLAVVQITGGTISGSIQCVEEDTGVDPTI